MKYKPFKGKIIILTYNSRPPTAPAGRGIIIKQARLKEIPRYLFLNCYICNALN